jgi:hypothetical protein
MTPDEFIQRTYEIEVEREATLKPHQLGDLRTYRKVVRREGKVTSLDEYFLTIIGVPMYGYFGPTPPRRPGSRKEKPIPVPEKQESLF